MKKHLTRRNFLIAAGIAGGGFALGKLGSLRSALAGLNSSPASGALLGTEPPLLEDPPPEPPPPTVTHWDGSPMGRILLGTMTIYTEPSWKAGYAGSLYYNDVVPVHGALVGEGLYSTNHTWLQVEQGFIYSSWVQPVAHIDYNPIIPIGEGGAWGVITVPITYSRYAPSDEASARERLYYNQVKRIVGVENDYYKAAEIFGSEYWLKAGHVRLIPPEEIAPISPHIPPEEKRIEISVGEQVLRAYEGENLVFASLVSTGVTSSQTPFGEFRVRDKRHGQRMVGGQTGGGYNLAGVPWICYFTSSWAAIHGCYWHNDYGRRHSNGCVNMHPSTAQWVFRWTTPHANYWDFHTVPNDEAGQPGTRVIVQW